MKSRLHAKHTGISPAAEQSNLEVVVNGNTTFAFDLYAALQDQEGNLFFSPYSISTALAMTYAGARGNTAHQMADVLHFTLDQTRLHPAFADLIGSLQAMPEESGYHLTIANALWGQQDFGFLEEFLEVTRASYEAGLHEVDFETDPESVRKTINDWVEKKTEQKIQDLIPPGVLDALTQLVLTNAIYFKGKWTHPFEEEDTKDDLFSLLNGNQVIVPMMHQTEEFRYMENDIIQMLELPYLDDELAMMVILPKQVAGLPDLEHALTGETVTSWMSELSKLEVIVSMPTFNLTSAFRLADVLKSLGMTDAFSENVADFSGMTEARNLFIKAVVHKAFVDVNEEGTEAAAATAVVMMDLSAELPPEPKHFRADHPFLFLICDRRTKSIVFLGRVMNPGDRPDAAEEQIRTLKETSGLMHAVKRGYTDTVHALLDRGADPNTHDEDKTTALMWAVRSGYTDIVKVLLDNEAEVNAEKFDWKGNFTRLTALRLAAEEGHTEIVRILLDNGARDVSAALRVAAEAEVGHTEIVRMLLDNGADVNMEAEFGRTPLISAVLMGHTEIVQLLLDRGTDVNAENGGGETALMCAAKRGHTDIVRILLDNGAKVNMKSKSHRTALIGAAGEGHTDTVQLLLDHGAEVNVRDYEGKTALIAAGRGSSEVVQLLLDHGAEANARDNNRRTALIAAAERERFDIVRLLLDLGAEVDLKGMDGRILLGKVAKCGHTDMLKFLLDNGANVETKDPHGRPILISAVIEGQTDTVRTLLTRGADVNVRDQYGRMALIWVAERGHIDILQLLLDNGAEVQDSVGKTALGKAAQQGHTRIFELLKNAGAKGSKNIDLVHAVVTGNTADVTRLLDSGASENTRNRQKRTVLMWAAEKGHTDIVRLLLEHGADVNVRDEYGHTAVMEAVSGGHSDIVRLLLDHGVDMHSGENEFALMVAAEGGHTEIVKLLRKRKLGNIT